VKEFRKLVSIWQSYGKSTVAVYGFLMPKIFVKFQHSNLQASTVAPNSRVIFYE